MAIQKTSVGQNMANQIGLNHLPISPPLPILQNPATTAAPPAPLVAATLTISHEHFEHLLKMAHGDRQSVSLANAGISVNKSTPIRG